MSGSAKKSIHPSSGTDEVDILFSFELLETLRFLPVLKDDPVILVNQQKILPPSVTLGRDVYPDNIAGLLKERYPRFELVNAQGLALQAGNARAVNVAFVGALSRYLDVPENSWHAAIEKMLPPKLVEVNLKAFALGREKNTKLQGGCASYDLEPGIRNPAARGPGKPAAQKAAGHGQPRVCHRAVLQEKI